MNLAPDLFSTQFVYCLPPTVYLTTTIFLVFTQLPASSR